MKSPLFNILLLAGLSLSTLPALAGDDYPTGCFCKDAFKKVMLEVTDPAPPYTKRKVQKIQQVKGLLHCNCGKQECVIAVPAGRELIQMSCAER